MTIGVGAAAPSDRRGGGVAALAMATVVALAGCAGSPLTKAAALMVPGSVTLMPGFGSVSAQDGTGALELGLVRGGAHGELVGEDGAEPIDANVWGIGIRGHGVVPRRTLTSWLEVGLMGHGGMEGGAIGQDPYGRVGADVGPALVLARRFALGAQVGYHYGGYAANGHRLPLRLAAIVDGGWFALRAAAWRGLWLGPADAGHGSLRTRGYEAGLLLGRTMGAMISVERYEEDGLDVTSLWMSFGIRRTPT
jgi:hypothetical protein